MNSLAGLTFDSLPIRFVEHPEGKYGFGIVAIDLAVAIESEENGSKLSRSVRPEWKGVHNLPTLGGNQNVTVIWEPGVYQLLAVSRKPKAEPFQTWLFEEVIPSIRKTGSYTTNKLEPIRQLPSFVEYANAFKDVLDMKPHLPAALVQLLLDKAGDELCTGKPKQLTSTIRLIGVAQKAEEMGLPVTEKNRATLGKFVKASGLKNHPQEERLCNGQMRKINVYEDSVELEETITAFFR
jgi:prophage antirepressor-like protein